MSDGERPPQAVTPAGMLGYVAYAVPVTGLSAAVVNLIPAYYAEVLGLSLASVGLVFFGLRIFDAFTDPLMGWLLDRHPFSRQHKPWVLIAFPLFLVGGGLLFFPIERFVGVPYLLAAGFLVYSAYTVALVTHQAWGAAIARDAAALSTLFGFREIAIIVGILCVFLAPAIAEELGYAGLTSKVFASSVFLFASLVVCTVLSLWLAPDDSAGKQSESVPFEVVRAFVVGRDFILLSIANLAINFAMVALSVLSYYTSAYVFEASDRYGLAMTLYFVSATAGMGLWMPLARRIGDYRTLRLAALYVLVGLALLPFWAQLEWSGTYLVFMVVLGIGFGAGPFLIRSMIGVLAHAHEAQTGESVRGAAYAVTTFFDKLGSGAAAGIVLPLIGWLGFDAVDGGGEVGRNVLLWVGVSAPILGFALVLAALSGVRHRAAPGSAGIDIEIDASSNTPAAADRAAGREPAASVAATRPGD